MQLLHIETLKCKPLEIRALRSQMRPSLIRQVNHIQRILHVSHGIPTGDRVQETAVHLASLYLYITTLYILHY